MRCYSAIRSTDSAGTTHVSLFEEGLTGAVGHYYETTDPWTGEVKRTWLMKPPGLEE